jgi:hypothetical protein
MVVQVVHMQDQLDLPELEVHQVVVQVLKTQVVTVVLVEQLRQE